MSKKMNFASAPMSIAHTYGNMTAFVTEKIKSWFHPEFFKTVNISSTIASRYYNVLQNTNKDFMKKEKPYLIIRPRVVNGSDEAFLAGTFLTNRIADVGAEYDPGNLQPFLNDKQKGLEIKFLMNRPRIMFDVTIMVDTLMAQLNLENYIRNRVIIGRPLTWETALESQIPREILAGVSYITDIPLTDPASILQYMNGNSLYPVTYKMKNSTGNDEYFRYYPASVDVLVSDLQMDDGSKKEMVDDVYTINFTVETEFTTAGIYHIFSKRQFQLMHEEVGEWYRHERGQNKLAMDILFTPYEDLGIDVGEGWNLYCEPAYAVTSSPDVLDFSAMINPSLRQLLDYHLKMNIPLDNLIKVSILKDRHLLDPIKGDFTIDFKNCILHTYRVSKLSTYRLIILVNTAYANETVKSLLDLENK